MEEIICKNCGSKNFRKRGFSGPKQRWQCRDCNTNTYILPTETRIVPKVTPQKNEIIMTAKIGLTEAEIREKYDVGFIVRQHCEKLKEGVYLQDAEFIQSAGIRAIPGYRQILDHPDFSSFRGKAKGAIVYWSHPKSIKKLKDDGIFT